MSLQLSKIQIEVLNMLLDVYENSVTYKGKNIKNQSFAIKPEKIFYDYNGDYTDQEEVMEFMLTNNCKLEQEIISWLNERN